MAWMRIVIHHMRNGVGIVVGRVGVGVVLWVRCNLMWNCFMFCTVVLYVSVSP